MIGIVKISNQLNDFFQETYDQTVPQFLEQFGFKNFVIIKYEHENECTLYECEHKAFIRNREHIITFGRNSEGLIIVTTSAEWIQKQQDVFDLFRNQFENIIMN